MKKCIVILMLTAVILTCSGCTTSTEKTEIDFGRFKSVQNSDRGYSHNNIFVDRETGVMYVFIKSGNGAGLTVMLDSEGKPLIWQEKE